MPNGSGTFDADPRIDLRLTAAPFGYSAWRNFDLDRPTLQKIQML